MSKFKFIFLKQDLFKMSTLVFSILSLLAGFTVIYSNKYLGGHFDTKNIYSLFSTISDFLLIYIAVNTFGKEVKYRTINLIRISGRSYSEIIIRKLLGGIILSVMLACLALSEVFIYKMLFNQVGINIYEIGKNLVISYVVFYLFLFSLGSLIVMLLKKTLFSYITLLLILRISPMVLNMLENISNHLSKVVDYIPLSFLEQSFYYANYSQKQVYTVIIWSLIILLVLPEIYKRKGYA